MASSKNRDYRLGVDVGGTFTDVCVITPDGETVRAKTPSTPQDQSVGVKDGITKVRKLLKSKYDWDGEFSFIHHGSTVATNAILESKGVKAGLIVTAGFKEVLTNRRCQIPGGLGGWISYIPPEPVVPLERTVQCTGRIDPSGRVVIPFDEDALRRDLADLKRQQPEAITISLLNSYVNNEHERAVERIVREEFGPQVEIICSADVLPEAALHGGARIPPVARQPDDPHPQERRRPNQPGPGGRAARQPAHVRARGRRPGRRRRHLQADAL
ncbi:hypothetical protein G7054_g994 [Neopestalotiopsis clavispora]|nr:hypothetical protein G7054_g994 [Neopestalotiopsis clavispora]